MNYATSLNSVSSASASSITSANSSYVNPHTSLQNHTPPNTSLTEPSPTSPASMAAAMFYQQQQAAVAAAGFDAAAAAAAAVAGNPSGHHQGPLASAAAIGALANNTESPRYPWMSITGMSHHSLFFLDFYSSMSIAYNFIKRQRLFSI